MGVGVQHHFRIALGLKTMPQHGQDPAQFPDIIDLPIIGYGVPLTLVEKLHRLLPLGNIYNGQAAMEQCALPLRKPSRSIGASLFHSG